VRAGFEKFVTSDLAKYNIDLEMIAYEDGGNKKTAKH